MCFKKHYFCRTMEKKTSNKRKYLADAKEIPNKIRKTTNIPVTQKINKKSPKSAKIIKKIIDNKSTKSSNKNRKTPEEKQSNGKQNTPKGRKIVKEEDETDDESDSSHETVNSDNEVEKEDDSDEETEIDEADSDEEEAISTEEKDKNNEDEVKALEKDKYKTNELKTISVLVSGLNHSTKINDIFQDCNIFTFKLLKNQMTKKPNGRATIYFKDKESQEKALEKNQKEFNGRIITVIPPGTLKTRTDLSVFVKGLKPYSKVTDIFKDCNIDTLKVLRNRITNEPTGRAFVTFKDKESVTKALAKDDTQFDGYVLTVEPSIKELKIRTEFQAFVKNLCPNGTKLEDIFEDCKIHKTLILRDRLKNRPNGMAVIDFEDDESLQKALLKHETEYDGRVITVLRNNCTVFVKNLNLDSKLEDVFKECNIQWIDLITDKRTNEYVGRANVNFKDKESLEKALSKNNVNFDGKTIKVELHHGKQTQMKSGNISKLKQTGNTYTPGSNIPFLRKKILLEELKNEAQKLEREIYGKPKHFNKKERFRKYK